MSAFRSSYSEQASGQAELERHQPQPVRPSQRMTQKDWDGRWHSAGDWCAEHLPDLIDARTGVSCGFAVASALRLKHELGQTPSPADVRRERALWMRRLDLTDAI